jgi:hypothetical protein
MNQRISRRTMLRGAGAALALPSLESMTPRSRAAQKLAKPPVRSAFFFMPNGVVPSHWTPEGDEEDYEITPMLKPLAPHKEEFLLLENLWNKQTVGRNGHWPKVPAWLSGGYVERGTGGDLDTGGTSVDQIIARKLGHRTSLPSFELGLDEPRTGIDNIGGGFPRILGSHMAWRDPHTPVPKETIPQLAFDRLFRTGSAFPVLSGLDPNSKRVQQSLQRDDASVLDLVLSDAKSLRGRVSGGDREKIDEYLESVRSVERRLEATLKPQKRWINEGRLDVPRPGPGRPESHAEHVRLMLDILVLAFWTDSTRVATLMMGDAQSSQSFGFLPGVINKSFHGISHYRKDMQMRDMYEKVGTWHVAQFAYVVDKMKKLDEGGTSLLDNSMLLFGSSIRDGNTHKEQNLPLVLAGGGSGSLRPGRRVRAPKDTPMCNLHLSIMNRMGVEADKFGDSTGLLKGLS